MADVFDQPVHHSGINSVKWDFMRIQDKRVKPDTLPFWIADMDFACPPPLLEAIKNRLDRMPLGYSKPDDDYYAAVCGWMEKQFAWNVSPDNIFTSAGVVRALIDLILALTTPGEGIIIQRPVYYPFSAIIHHTGRKIVNNPLQHDQGVYSMDFADLERKAGRPDTTMMILCSPHNPVGRVWTEDELYRAAQICLNNNVQLISDEIHFDLLRKDVTHIPIARMFPETDTIITCTAPSKTFNTAGMQISNVIIQNKTLKKKWRTQIGVEFPAPLAITAVKAAYTQCDDWLAQLLDYLDSNFLFMETFLKKHLPKARFIIPQGTYLGWIDFSDYGYKDEELATLLLKKAHVLLESGTIFGPEGTGFQRINVACPRATLEQGLQQIAGVLN
jgi:cystathionine beta-lyase